MRNALMRSHPAFTIVELLVVISIMALLIGLILPALGLARGSARRAVCLSNQRQISLAISVYANQHHDRYPSAYYYLNAAGIPVGTFTNHIVGWDTINDHGTIKPGLIWQAAGSYEIQQCPSHEGASNTIMNERYSGYNYNTTFIGRGLGETPWGGMTTEPARVSDINDPARTALVGDGGYVSGANKSMRAHEDLGIDTITRHAGGQAYRHLDATNVTWADGHGSSTDQRHQSPAANPATLAIQGWPDNGFLSSDNSLYDRQ